MKSRDLVARKTSLKNVPFFNVFFRLEIPITWKLKEITEHMHMGVIRVTHIMLDLICFLTSLDWPSCYIFEEKSNYFTRVYVLNEIRINWQRRVKPPSVHALIFYLFICYANFLQNTYIRKSDLIIRRKYRKKLLIISGQLIFIYYMPENKYIIKWIDTKATNAYKPLKYLYRK